MARNSFDEQLFTWENWNNEGPLSMQYSNVELKVAVGSYPAGSKFPFAFILGDMSMLVLVDEQHEEHGFDLKLAVGEEVQAEACPVPDADSHGESHDEECGCGHDH
jgi:hypothetical protein